MLLVVGGIKGGSGKTTLAINLAVCRAKEGKKVFLVDADDQKSIIDWYRHRKGIDGITVGADTGRDLYERLQELRDQGKFDDIIVDTGGRDTTSQRSALVICDAFLVPFRPKSLDIWTLTSVRNLNSEVRSVNGNLKIMAVLNQCDPRSKDRETARKIIEDNALECLPTELGYRKAFSDATAYGQGVIELKTADEKSVEETLSLHRDIYKTDMLHTSNRSEKHIWLSATK